MNYSNPAPDLSDEAQDAHYALESLTEEIEAVDWYNQRIDRCKDKALKELLIHNRDEEKEHASMLLEWLRRKDTAFEKEMKDWLFSNKEFHN